MKVIMFSIIGIVLVAIPLLVKHPAFSAADTPLTAPIPSSDEYEVRFARSGGRVYITEFEDSHGHHCIMGKYNDNIVLSCEGH